jgi:hypothetical protein
MMSLLTLLLGLAVVLVITVLTAPLLRGTPLRRAPSR